MENQYYDGTKLLSLKDKNGLKPTIYISTSNRSAGKTTYFNRLVLRRFIKTGKKFCLLYRFNYELEGCSTKFFSDIKGLFFPKYIMSEKTRNKGVYKELFIAKSYDEPGTSCGYAIALNSADSIKKVSHVFNDVDVILFDEFQSETNNYCPKEVEKFLSIHKSIARGHGQQYREVSVYMISNHVSIINPYYIEMGICLRLKQETKYLRGDGWVLEQGFIESAANAGRESGIARAFKDNDYVHYSNDLVYLNDNLTFIDRPNGRSEYLATIFYNGTGFAIRQFQDQNICYVDDKIDESCPIRISVTMSDHSPNTVMLMQYVDFVHVLRLYFDKGCMRFRDMRAKEAFIKMIAYS